MSNPADTPDVYNLLFEQLPPILRWALGVLTLGLFSIAGWAWRRQERSIQKIEEQMHARMDREMHDVHRRLDEMNSHLIEIAKNTSRGK